MPDKDYRGQWDFSSASARGRGRSVSDRRSWRERKRREWERKQRRRGKRTMLGLLVRGGSRYRGE